MLPVVLARKTKATNLITFGEGGDVYLKKTCNSLLASFSIFGEVFEAELSPITAARVGCSWLCSVSRSLPISSLNPFWRT